MNGKRVSKIYGSYMGYIEFDNKRYWDYEHMLPFQLMIDPPNELVKSDHQFRSGKRISTILLRSKTIIEEQSRRSLKRKRGN